LHDPAHFTVPLVKSLNSQVYLWRSPKCLTE
jgi:hypothetical protein